MKKCQLCESQTIKTHWLYKDIDICKGCTVAKKSLKENVDYESFTAFSFTEDEKNLWIKFANRDYLLIKKLIEEKHIKKIIDVGSGYGFLAEVFSKQKPEIDFWNLEQNKVLTKHMANRGLKVLNHIELDDTVDLIIMNHCLEHIENPMLFVNNLKSKYKNANFLFFQTDYTGFIPTYFPFLWYGWSHSQHYWHFTPRAMPFLFKNTEYVVGEYGKYSLDQKVDFTFKGMIKIPLRVLNKFLSRRNYDAFYILFSKEIN